MSSSPSHGRSADGDSDAPSAPDQGGLVVDFAWNSALTNGVAQDSSDTLDSVIKLIHFVLGCTVLMPWNVLITALPFFLARVSGSSFQEAFSSYLSISHISSQFVFLAHATAFSKSFSPSRQTRFNTISLFILMFLLTLSTFVPATPYTYFKFSMIISVIMAANVSYLQSSVFAVASMFGPLAIQAVVAGEAAVAVTVNVVQLASVAISLSRQDNDVESSSIWSLPGTGRSPEELSALVFFAFATCFLGMSVLAHGWLLEMQAYKILVAPMERKIFVDSEINGERQPLLGSTGPAIAGGFGEESTKERILRVAKANIKYEIAVAYVFIVTLAVFPPITTAIMPTNPGFHPLLFSAFHFLIFNIGDLVGRYLCSFPSLLVSLPNRLLLLAFSHTLFIPLFLACNIHLPSSPSTVTPLINSDVLFFIILLAFGTSNGFTSSLCLMFAPSLEHNPGLKGKEDVDTAATIGIFCLVGGLTVGSFASFGIRAIVCGCNPFIG